MIYGIWQSAAGMQIQQYRQSLVANNLANVDTPAYKPDFAAILERPVESATTHDPKARHRVLDRLSGGLFEAPVHTDFSQGPLEKTDDPLDLALVGPGFLRIRTPVGELVTRDGRLAVQPNGTLTTASRGEPVLGTDGRPIRIDPLRPFDMDEAGRVRQAGELVGQISVVDFADPQALTKVGGNRYDAAAAERRPAKAELQRGVVEQSNADPVNSLVQMIAASRAYEMNATMISLQDSTLNRVVNDLGRLS